MKNYAIITSKSDISYAGEICHGQFFESGVVIKQSTNSMIKVWIPLEEVKEVIFPDLTVLKDKEICKIFEVQKKINNKYRLE